ncbi:MAG: putative Mg2+ transporter-C (MgtC) family protein, partial [Gammaproteobacteria bacterium]|nr:putative Mg2+ transporter-C (MgtC) family protein [Gammaproteobacteria bacterium]
MAASGAIDEFSRLVPDVPQLVRVTVRLLTALFIGTAIGLQRELTHKPAGLRTHMLLGLGTALFIVGAAEAGMAVDALSRIV